MVISGLIIAKKESKRLKNKNWRKYWGKPMFQHNLEKCLVLFDKVYVSSDFDYILDISKKLGAIPIERPDHLLECPNISVYLHALEFMDNPDAIVAVQANSPGVNIKTIKEVKFLLQEGYNEVKTAHPGFKDYGSVWGMTVDRLLNYPDPYHSKPDMWVVDRSVDIHTIEDLWIK